MTFLAKISLGSFIIFSINAMADIDGISINSNTRVHYSETDSGVTYSKHKITAQLTKKIKAVIMAELNNGLQDDDLIDDKKYKKIFKEAYLIYHANDFFTLIFGRRGLQLGAYSKLAGEENSLAYKLNKEEYPVAITVKIKPEQLIRGFQFSIFETGKSVENTNSSKEIGDFDGFSVSAGVDLDGQTQAYTTYMEKGNDENTEDKENRAIVGVIYRTDGWEFGTEGIWMKNNPLYSDADFAFVLSAAKKMSLLGEKGELLVEYTSINNEGDDIDTQSDLAVEYKIDINGGIIAAPSIRLSEDEKGESETSLILNMIFKFQRSADKNATLLE